MKHDLIVDGEAMAEVEGVDVSYLVGSARILDLQVDPERAAWQAYRVAFNDNASIPNLKHAAALVKTWNALARLLELEQV